MGQSMNVLYYDLVCTVESEATICHTGIFPGETSIMMCTSANILFAEINTSTALRIWRNRSLNCKGMTQEFIEQKINSLLCSFSL